MTNPHMQAAIEAGAKALPGIPAHDEELRLMQNTARAVIEAALPHLREMIAEEIRALMLNPSASNTPHCVEEYNAGLQNAAVISGGKLLTQTPAQTKELLEGPQQ